MNEALNARKHSRFLLHFNKKIPEEVIERQERLLRMSHDNSMPMSLSNDISEGSEGNKEDKEAVPTSRKHKKEPVVGNSYSLSCVMLNASAVIKDSTVR